MQKISRQKLNMQISRGLLDTSHLPGFQIQNLSHTSKSKGFWAKKVRGVGFSAGIKEQEQKQKR